MSRSEPLVHVICDTCGLAEVREIGRVVAWWPALLDADLLADDWSVREGEDTCPGCIEAEAIQQDNRRGAL